MLDTARQLAANSGQIARTSRCRLMSSSRASLRPTRLRPSSRSMTSVDDELILDIGPETASRFAEIIAAAGTIIWNGPVGVFEFDAFGEGTRVLAEAIADSAAFSVAGGGDTLAAIDKYGVADQISYISTGGGAFLEFVEGKTRLPARRSAYAAGQGPVIASVMPGYWILTNRVCAVRRETDAGEFRARVGVVGEHVFSAVRSMPTRPQCAGGIFTDHQVPPRATRTCYRRCAAATR